MKDGIYYPIINDIFQRKGRWIGDLGSSRIENRRIYGGI
jgi:hypothetical protein